jgi:hypothetical protein
MTQKIKSRATRALAALALLVPVFVIAGLEAPSFATCDPTTDPTCGSGDSLFTTLTDYLTTHLVPLVVGLAVVGIAVSLLIKWGKKAAKSG